MSVNRVHHQKHVCSSSSNQFVVSCVQEGVLLEVHENTVETLVRRVKACEPLRNFTPWNYLCLFFYMRWLQELCRNAK